MLAVTPSGHLTARAAGREFPPEGSSVVDSTGRLHGRVVRVFGPVERPYLSIRLPRLPRADEGSAVVGATVYREGRGEHAER